MFFKKIALFVIVVGLTSGFTMQTAQADAKEKLSGRAYRDAVETAVPVAAGEDIAQNVEETQEPVAAQTAEPVASTEEMKEAGQSTAVEEASLMELGAGLVKLETNTAPKEPKAATEKKSATSKLKEKKYNKSDLRLMASIINCEAGGERFQGQVAVGIVVMNRVKSKAFPNTIRKVIYQKGQFTPTRNGAMRQKLNEYDGGRTNTAQWKSCIKAAKKVLDGQRTVKLKGRTRSMKGVRFFSVNLSGAKFRLGGHRFR